MDNGRLAGLKSTKCSSLITSFIHEVSTEGINYDEDQILRRYVVNQTFDSGIENISEKYDRIVWKSYAHQ